MLIYRRLRVFSFKTHAKYVVDNVTNYYTVTPFACLENEIAGSFFVIGDFLRADQKIDQGCDGDYRTVLAPPIYSRRDLILRFMIVFEFDDILLWRRYFFSLSV